MLGWLRTVLLTLIFALLGAAAGRAFAEQRRRVEAGEPDLLDEGPAACLDVAMTQPKPQEIVPGLVAALRVRDRPWSFLGIPPWAAAFAVNFVVAAMGRSLGEAFERAGFAVPRARDAATVADEFPAHEEAGSWTAPRPPDPPPDEGFTPFEE